MTNKLVAACILMICVCAPLHAANYYMGSKFALMDADIGGFDTAFDAGIVIGVEVKNEALDKNFRYGAELEYMGNISDGHVSTGGLDSEWDINTYAIYGVVKYGKTAYVKARLGYLNEDLSINISTSSSNGDDSGLSGGVGAGYRLTEKVSVEAEFTVIEDDVDMYSVGLNYIFR